MVALYGGSFDPVHIGHLRIAEDIREYYRLEKIIFIPAYHSPLKPGSRASAVDRLEMLKRSIEINPFFSLDDIELKRRGKSYTIDTIKYFRKKLNYTPAFILGTDAFLSLHMWKSAYELVKITNFIVAGRDKTSFYEIKEYVKEYFPFASVRLDKDIPKEEGGNIFYSDIRRIDVSSTEIRNRIKEGKSIRYLVLPSVEEYILLKNLYRG